MKLSEMLQDMPYLLGTRGDVNTEIGALTIRSRERTENGLFFCIPGTRVDAHQFAPEAVRSGCTALVVDHYLDDESVRPVTQVLVSNVRGALSYMAAAFNGWPSRRLKLAGITGTKGKTTTSYMLKAILEKAGFKCGLIGTTGNMVGQRRIESHLTTPDPLELQHTLRLMADEGVEVVVMEVSAHAIDMKRLDGMVFDVGCYTNLSQDHLDYFGTMERYFETKKRFFTEGLVKEAALNADDGTTADILRDLTVPKITFGICNNADLYARDISRHEEGVSFSIYLHGETAMPVRLKMAGTFNVYNALAAAACALILGVQPAVVAEGLESVESVPGRVEMLHTGTPYRVILDYSHSPDALQNILTTVREFAQGRVIALFGCGGDRDETKRLIMGRIGGELADFCVLTSDNPRSEDPMEILSAIEEGIRPTGKPYRVIENRREAIRFAMSMGAEGDVIVLCGKGHETYQEIQGVRHPFDEKKVVQELLEEMGTGKE